MGATNDSDIGTYVQAIQNKVVHIRFRFGIRNIEN